MIDAPAVFGGLDLTERLVTARRGTAYFAHHLAQLTDDALDEETLLAGWSRKHLVAHVGYNAAALCRLLDWAATGAETPMYASPEQRAEEIGQGATLGPAALRNLFDHTVARLDHQWRRLPAAAWRAQVRTAQGRLVPAEETVWMRTREVWIHAVDLANGAAFGDFPTAVLESLLEDIVGAWRRREVGAGLVLAVEGRSDVVVDTASPPTARVGGGLAAVTRWAAGRGAVDVDVTSPRIAPPRWL